MGEQTVVDWGNATPGPASTRRTDPRLWILASIALGAALSAMVLWLSWRALPLLPAPLGNLGAHASHWVKLILRLGMPSWFAQEAAAYASFWASASGADRFAIGWRAVVGAISAITPAIWLAPRMLVGRDGLMHLRGSRRFTGPAAARELKERLASRVKKRPDHDIAPGLAYPSDLWTRHVLFVAVTGAGKSTALKPLIEKVIKADEQALIFDPKSEFTMGFARPEIMAPWDARSLAWDLARDMRNALDMRRFAVSVIRDSHDPMWSNASRQLLVGLMIFLKRTRGTDWGWQELADLVSQPQPQLLAIMKRCHPEAIRAVEKASVTSAGILINLSAFCSPIFDLAEAWGDAPPERRVSFVDWTLGRTKHRQIIMQGHGAYAELTKAYVEGIVGIVSAMVNSVEMVDDPKRKIWFIADELPQMGKIPIRPLFEVGRSRGVRCVVACQDFAQLEEIYGASMVKAVVSMSGTLLVGQMMQGDTAEALCKAFGSREIERANVSTATNGAGAQGGSRSLSFAREEVALYKPSELSSRLGLTQDGKGVRLILFTEGNAFELFWPHYGLRTEREGHVPAPWTLGAGGDLADDPSGNESPNPASPPQIAHGGAPDAADLGSGVGSPGARA